MPSADAADRLLSAVDGRVATLPGVRAVAAVNGLPLTGLGAGSTFRRGGPARPRPSSGRSALLRSVTPAYFRTMAIPLLAGRDLPIPTTAQSPPVIVINQTLARRFWPGANAIGGRIAIDQNRGPVAEIVGVVGDVKPDRIEGEDWPTLYSPYAQAPVGSP